MFAAALAFADGLPIIGPIIRNIKIVLICAAVVVVTNGITATVFYVKGYNSAATKCKMNTVIRERDEARRDLAVQKDTAEYYKLESQRLQAAEVERKLRDGQYAATIAPITGCVAPSVSPGRVRH